MHMMNKSEQNFRPAPGVTLRYLWVSWLEGEWTDVLVFLQLEVFDFYWFYDILWDLFISYIKDSIY